MELLDLTIMELIKDEIDLAARWITIFMLRQKILIPAETLGTRMNNTPLFGSSSESSKEALPTVVLNTAMLNLRVRVFLLLLKISILVEKFTAKSNEYNTSGSASRAHFACVILLSTPTQTNGDDMHDQHPMPPLAPPTPQKFSDRSEFL